MKTELHYKKIKGSSLNRKAMIPAENLNLQKRKRIRNGHSVSK